MLTGKTKKVYVEKKSAAEYIRTKGIIIKKNRQKCMDEKNNQ